MKLGAGFTVRRSVVVLVSVPATPVIDTVTVPSVAELLAVSVSTLAPDVGLGVNAAVTSPGRPEAARLTLPVNPFWPVTVMLDVPEEPWIMVREAGEIPRVKLDVPVPLSAMLCVA